MQIPAARLRRSLLLSIVLALALPWQALAADPVPPPIDLGSPDASPSAEPVADPTPAPDPSPSPELATPAPDPSPAETPAPSATPDPVPSESPAPAESPTPPPTPIPSPTPVVQVVSVNLYRAYSAVHQYTMKWCVPANAQKMLNIINRKTDRTYTTQLRYSRQVRSLNGYRYVSGGNDVRGWARFLDAHVGGLWHYADRSFGTRTQAINAMAESIDRTGHPVGIVVGRGTHAWTVVGYRATVTEGVPGRTIVGLYVSGSLRRDPFSWRYMTLSEFASHYTRYHEATRRVIWEGKFVIVSE
jgi:hypothetical protein